MCHIRQWSHWGSLFLHHRIPEYCSMHSFSPSWRSLKHIFWEYWGEAVCHLKICFLGDYFKLVILRNKRFRNFDLPLYLPKGIQIEKPAWRRGAIMLAQCGLNVTDRNLARSSFIDSPLCPIVFRWPGREFVSQMFAPSHLPANCPLSLWSPRYLPSSP